MKYKLSYPIQIILTAIILVVSLVFQNNSTGDLIFLGVLVGLIGIPHGSTDFLIFKKLAKKKSEIDYIRFGLLYLVAMVGVVLVWVLHANLALLMFLGVSIYHFGQSNLQHIRAHKIIKFISYILSGAFVIIVPISVHFVEAQEIMATLTGNENIYVSERILATLPRELLLANIWLLLFLGLNKMISIEECIKEVLYITLLFCIFHFSTLIVAFTTYFVLWHSWNSIIDQLEFLKQENKEFNLLKYYIQATPVTLISFLGMTLLVALKDTILPNFTYIDLFFITISVITLPHIIIIEQLYKTEQHQNQLLTTAIS